MAPALHSLRGEQPKEWDDLSTLSQLEGQRKEAGEIVYRWFRFRARRGLGLFYSLLSFLPLIGSILGTLFASEDVTLAGITVGIVCFWVVARVAGFRGFGRMRSTIELLKEDVPMGGRSQDLKRAATFVVIVLWPWIAYAVATTMGNAPLEVLFALVWLVEFVTFRVVTLKRNKNPIVGLRIEDWVVIVSIPVAALLSAFQIVSNAPPFFGFTLVSPLLLFSGLKSLYDAPKELVGGLGAESE